MNLLNTGSEINFASRSNSRMTEQISPKQPKPQGTDKNADIYFFKIQKLDQSRGPLIAEETISSLQASQA